ncbi:unnamed protein product [Parnassius mnemosyne]|uniref:Reverse transcriptase n=1 Tax=Parnassius mnemosyne TaxID=213953 RepID=A0AAV1L5H1_9NEOP
MLEQNIIRPSDSAWSSPIWIVPKKADASGKIKWRLVVDFRKVNEKTVDDKYPIPNITDVLDKLGKCQYFTTLDLASGFYQVEMDPADIHKTAFNVENGHYEFLRMPMGLKNSPSTFQRGGYGMKIKAVHVITHSKTAETIFTFCKQILSAKLFQRFQIHKDLESLHKVVQRDVLPEELGGNERSITKLHRECIDVISSKEFQEYYSEMKGALTNEKYRQTDKFNEEYMGIAGTFKTLNVD